MIKKYTGLLPINAGVTVDYVNNKVRFKYPSKKIERNAKSSAIMHLYSIFMLLSVIGIGISIIPLIIFNIFLDFITLMSIIFILPIFVSLGIYFLSGNKFAVWYPKLNLIPGYIFRDHIYSKTVKSISNKKFEIPLFRNTILKYDTKGDFAKYLQKIEIKEHDFYTDNHKQDQYWKATFLFSRNCSNGWLKVSFR